jgi:hypothetical protein
MMQPPPPPPRTTSSRRASSVDGSVDAGPLTLAKVGASSMHAHAYSSGRTHGHVSQVVAAETGERKPRPSRPPRPTLAPKPKPPKTAQCQDRLHSASQMSSANGSECGEVRGVQRRGRGVQGDGWARTPQPVHASTWRACACLAPGEGSTSRSCRLPRSAAAAAQRWDAHPASLHDSVAKLEARVAVSTSAELQWAGEQ